MKREFTGRHMAIVICSGFGVVIAVNLLLATLAVRGFGGVVVPNSYVASQKFNGWLEAADRQKALGWSAAVSRADDGHLLVSTVQVPAGATITAIAERPLGKPETMQLRLREASPGRHRSIAPLAPGRWIIRMTIVSGRNSWAARQQLS